jgi:hypothetical protein
VEEFKPGGIKNFKTRMERSAGVKFVPVADTWETVRSMPIIQDTLTFLQRRVGTSGTRPAKEPTLPQHNAKPMAAVRDTQVASSTQQSLRVMACMHQNRYGKTLSQERIDSVSTDRELFNLLNEQYRKQRGGLKSTLSMRAIKGILFIKVSCILCHRYDC